MYFKELDLYADDKPTKLPDPFYDCSHLWGNRISSRELGDLLHEAFEVRKVKAIKRCYRKGGVWYAHL